MPDALKAGWVRIKPAGSDDDAPTAVVTQRAFDRVWSQKKDDGGNALWEVVAEEAGPEPAAAVRPTRTRAAATQPPADGGVA